MKGLTVIVKDNETGEILRETECNSIYAGIGITEEEAAVMVLNRHSNAVIVAGALNAANTAVKHAIEEHPELKLLLAILDSDVEKAGEENE